MFLKSYRKKIAEQVEKKMYHMRTCPNERDTILHIIAPKDFSNCTTSHCDKDCNHYDCRSYRGSKVVKYNPAKDIHPTPINQPFNLSLLNNKEMVTHLQNKLIDYIYIDDADSEKLAKLLVKNLPKQYVMRIISKLHRIRKS